LIKSFRKIFALLVLVEATSSILQFLEEDVSDLDLPFSEVKHDGIHGLCRRGHTGENEATSLKWLRRPRWTLTRLRSFAYYQWKLLAPFFYQDDDGDIKHYRLDDHHIFPFMTPYGMTEEATEREGGFGRVQMVNIHPDHHNFREKLSYGRGYAVKAQMFDDDRARFQKEIHILKKFCGARSHPHIVTLLATFEQFKRFHLIFHRAEGDLYTCWREPGAVPKINQRNALWMVEQCRGVVDGLLRIHRTLEVSTSEDGSKKQPEQETIGTFTRCERSNNYGLRGHTYIT
jgi:hypothetical protein